MLALCGGHTACVQSLIEAGATPPDMEWVYKTIGPWSESATGECFAVLVKETGIDPCIALERIKHLKSDAAQTARSMLEAQILGAFPNRYT